MKIEIVRADDERHIASVLRSGWDPPRDVVEGVRRIIDAVRAGRDAALVAYARVFDDPDFEAPSLRAMIPPIAAARSAVPGDVAEALERSRVRVEAFHRRQLRADIDYVEEDGARYRFCFRPLDSIAAYVPGGSAPLPSSVVMNVVPAKVAGVRRTIVLTPPQRDGSVHPAIVFACRLCGVDELYAVGGAHAVAAAAYGTESIAPVDKIVGPGNVWVTEAKRQVFGRCAIDGLAGPSEVLVVADESARVEYIVGELLAQAEHDALARVAVVSTSRAVLEACAGAIDRCAVEHLPRAGIIAAALRDGCSLIEAVSRDDVAEIVERFAPEHLSLQVADPAWYVERVRRAGAIFVGPMTPVACGDYLAGTNHVLPTSGAARFSSGLSTADFVRSFSVLENSAHRMRADAAPLAALADFEGLHQHAHSARMRERDDASI